MINHNWLPNIEFTWLSPAFGFVLLAAGVVEIFTAILFYFSESIEQKRYYIRILACMLVFDACVTHFPMSELERNYGKEVSHVCSDLALLGGLYMLAGFPEHDN